jgi:hypothetical protein
MRDMKDNRNCDIRSPVSYDRTDFDHQSFFLSPWITTTNYQWFILEIHSSPVGLISGVIVMRMEHEDGVLGVAELSSASWISWPLRLTHSLFLFFDHVFFSKYDHWQHVMSESIERSWNGMTQKRNRLISDDLRIGISFN